MEPFVKLSAVAAHLPLDNIDTDMIIPKQFLRTIARTGLGDGLFYDLRQDEDFVLNVAPFDKAQILIAGENFGCGSSREHAPWALLDFGIKAVIAPSFADIFRSNCIENGILPLKLPKSDIDKLLDSAAFTPITIDLEAQSVCRGNGVPLTFDIDAGSKSRLLNGLDSIGVTLESEGAISDFEKSDKQSRPWIRASNG